MPQSIVLNRNMFLIDGRVFSPRQIKLFWSMVARSRVPDDCWIWQGDRSKGGHGIFNCRPARGVDRNVPEYEERTGDTLWAHRIAYSLSSLLQVPEGLCVRHSCGLSPCCNPAHLITGTPAQNRQDTVDHRALEAKLTDADRAIIATSNARIPHLAKRFGVTNGIVWAIKYGKPGYRKTPHQLAA